MLHEKITNFKIGSTFKTGTLALGSTFDAEFDNLYENDNDLKDAIDNPVAVKSKSFGMMWNSVAVAKNSLLTNMIEIGSISYGNGIWVGKANQSKPFEQNDLIIMSTDRLNWRVTRAFSYNEYFLGGSAFGNGIFIFMTQSFTNNGAVIISKDGINWQPIQLPIPKEKLSSWAGNITFNNQTGDFLVIGRQSNAGISIVNDIFTSKDGVTWTARPDPLYQGKTVKWSTLKYVEPGAIPHIVTLGITTDNASWVIGKTQDNINWNIYPFTGIALPPNGNAIKDITATTLSYILIGNAANQARIFTSSDLQTWTQRTASNTNTIEKIEFGNTLAVITAFSGTTANQIMTSPDGITWTNRAIPTVGYWTQLHFSEGAFIATAFSQTVNNILISWNGINWYHPNGVPFPDTRAITYAQDKFVATFTNGPAGSKILTSDDGVNWVFRSTFRAADNLLFDSITYGIDRFVAVASSGTGYRVLVSLNGKDWYQAASANDAHAWRSVTFGNGRFVAVSGTAVGNIVMTSEDGILWTSRVSAAAQIWSAVCYFYGAGRFIAIGPGTRAMTSTDGITWTDRPGVLPNQTWNSIVSGNGILVAVSSDGATGRVAVSEHDAGTTWTLYPCPLQIWTNVTSANGMFVAVSSWLTGQPAGNRYMVSANGKDWILRPSMADTLWNHVCHGDGKFVAVGNLGNTAISLI